MLLFCSALIASLLLVSEASKELLCYQCGTEHTPNLLDTCEYFTGSPRWKPYEVACPEGSVCAKIVPAYGGNVSRSCTERETSFGTKLELGCYQTGEAEYDKAIFCYCDKNRCNSANLSEFDFWNFLSVLSFTWFLNWWLEKGT